MVKVYLSEQPADSEWGEDNLISYKQDTLSVHVGETQHRLRKIQEAGRRCYKLGAPVLQLTGSQWDLASQWAFYQGFTNLKQPKTLHFAPLSDKDQRELEARIQVYTWVKEIINRPAEDKPPLRFIETALQFLQQLAPGKITAEIITGSELLTQGFVGIHAVGRGSSNPPAMAVIEFNPGKELPVHAALVGKGIIFDSGGYSLKASPAMVSMKHDMGGAATVIGGLALAILRGLNKRIQVVLCCAENLISGNAYKLGDILRYKNGVSVEILNTDAEGRLVLADGLLKAAESKPGLIIDAGTLTGACMIALGPDYTGVFATDKALSEQALAAAEAEREACWPLPLETWHQNNVPSIIADTANSRAIPGGGLGAASNATGFLSRFVPDHGKGWLHLDLANAYYESETTLWPAGATGNTIRTIAALIA